VGSCQTLDRLKIVQNCVSHRSGRRKFFSFQRAPVSKPMGRLGGRAHSAGVSAGACYLSCGFRPRESVQHNLQRAWSGLFDGRNLTSLGITLAVDRQHERMIPEKTLNTSVILVGYKAQTVAFGSPWNHSWRTQNKNNGKVLDNFHTILYVKKINRVSDNFKFSRFASICGFCPREFLRPPKRMGRETCGGPTRGQKTLIPGSVFPVVGTQRSENDLVKKRRWTLPTLSDLL
jgi:hypothetical protein